MRRVAGSRRGFRLALAALLVLGAVRADAGGFFRKRERLNVVVPTVRTTTPGPIGTFYPNLYMTVRGNFPAGGGYSPNETFGDTSMDLYGPLSALRATSAPVLSYVRGYDGSSAIVEGTSFSTPNLPGNTPVVYPTQATYYYGFRATHNPPWWPKATNWIDQN